MELFANAYVMLARVCLGFMCYSVSLEFWVVPSEVCCFVGYVFMLSLL